MNAVLTCPCRGKYKVTYLFSSENVRSELDFTERTLSKSFSKHVMANSVLILRARAGFVSICITI
jgi:hypothetical protein